MQERVTGFGAGEAPRLRGERVLLRRWKHGDLAPFARMNADSEVMRYFPAPMDRAASDAMAHKADASFATLGFAVTAVSNHPSRRVMERIGMRHVPALDFDHPRVPLDHPLVRHVVYVIERETEA